MDRLTETSGGVRARRILALEGMCSPRQPMVDPESGDTLRPGRDRLSLDHPLVRANPGDFELCWRRDKEGIVRMRQLLNLALRHTDRELASRHRRSPGRADNYGLGPSRPKGAPVMATLTAPDTPSDCRRPPIAHIRVAATAGLYGAPIEGRPAPPEAEHCVVCAELWHRPTRRSPREIGAAAARARRNRRDRWAAAILEQAGGHRDNCCTSHGHRHGPLIACVSGLALCRECHQRRDVRALGETT